MPGKTGSSTTHFFRWEQSRYIHVTSWAAAAGKREEGPDRAQPIVENFRGKSVEGAPWRHSWRPTACLLFTAPSTCMQRE